MGKDHTIIPEFLVSNHVSFYQANSPLSTNLNILEITGATANITGSNEQNFYKIYSNTDFLKHFKVVSDDNKEMGEPIHIKMECKAIKNYFHMMVFIHNKELFNWLNNFITPIVAL